MGSLLFDWFGYLGDGKEMVNDRSGPGRIQLVHAGTQAKHLLGCDPIATELRAV